MQHILQIHVPDNLKLLKIKVQVCIFLTEIRDGSDLLNHFLTILISRNCLKECRPLRMQFLQYNTLYYRLCILLLFFYCSYGVVFWEILTRKYPYEGMEGFAIALQVANRQAKLEAPDSCPLFLQKLLKSKFCLTNHAS